MFWNLTKTRHGGCSSNTIIDCNMWVKASFSLLCFNSTYKFKSPLFHYSKHLQQHEQWTITLQVHKQTTKKPIECVGALMFVSNVWMSEKMRSFKIGMVTFAEDTTNKRDIDICKLLKTQERKELMTWCNLFKKWQMRERWWWQLENDDVDREWFQPKWQPIILARQCLHYF